MLKHKNVVKFINDKYINIYSINIPSDWCNYNDLKRDNFVQRWGIRHANITANKAESSKASFWGLAADNACDNKCNYETFLFYPMFNALTSYNSLTGVKRPKNKEYPALLDMEAIGFGNLLLSSKVLSNKNNIPFPKVFKTYIIQQAGPFIAKSLTRDDNYYLDTNKLDILHKDTNKSLSLPDESIFRPVQHWNVIWNKFGYQDIPLYRTDILRQWNEHKYYASKIKTKKYIFNQDKYEEYIKANTGLQEEFISFEPVSFNTTPKEDIIRYICQEALNEYYDFNDEFTFTVDGKNYTFDFDLEEFRDSDFNIVPFIRTFPNIVITMNEYKTIIKDLVTIEQTYFIQEILNKLKARDFDFSGFGYDQQKPYQFTDGQTIQFRGQNVLKYAGKNFGLYAAYKFSDFTTAPSDKQMMALFEPLSNDYPLIEYDNGLITFNQALDNEEVNKFSPDELSLLLFNLVTQTDGIQVEGNLDKYYIYLYEKFKTNKDSDIDECEVLPILLVEGVTCYNKALVRKETSRYVRTYIPYNEHLNYSRVFKDDIGYYVYLNQSTKLEEPLEVEFDILSDDEKEITKETRKIYYSNKPETSKINQEYIKDTVKFSLPSINISLDMRVKKLIKKFKNNQIEGYFFKYKDLTDNNIKIRLINDDDYLEKICDKEDIFFDMMPLIPFYSCQDMIQPLKTKSQVWNIRLGGLAGSRQYRYFYYIYDKKVLRYYKNTLRMPLLEWDTQINGQYEDKEYKVKTKKLSKIYTNEKSLFYSESFLQHPYSSKDKSKKASDIPSDYNSFFSSEGHGLYGFHSSIRFTFAIFFNKFVRKTKLLNKMAIEYLEFYFKNYNGMYDTEFGMYVYPNDRIQYIEKRNFLSFIKRKLSNDEILNLKAIYYSIFDYNAGKIIFYNKKKKEKYELNINKMYPKWKQVFFSDRMFIKSANKYDYLTIRLDDLVPLKYTDSININKNNLSAPIDTYKYVNGSFKLDLQSYYYNLPIVVRYNTMQGQIARKINFWKNANEYKTFYTPYDSYLYNQSYNANQLDNFQERNIYESLKSIFNKKSIEELELHYKDIFNKEIKLDKDGGNIFDYDGLFSNGMLSNEGAIDFEKEIRSEIIQTKTSIKLQEYEPRNVNFDPTNAITDPAKAWNYINEKNYHYYDTYFEDIKRMLVVYGNNNEWFATAYENIGRWVTNFNEEYIDIAKRFNYQNIELCQSKRLYDSYSANNLINPHFDKYQCIEEIVEYLLQNELPLYKAITPKMFKQYFIDYPKNNKLSLIFTAREIYELGFQNYLITSELDDLNDITITLPQIQKIISTLITKMDLNNGTIELNNYWLPLPIDAYKKFPFYSKKFCTSYFSLMEGYMCFPIPVVDSGIEKDNRAFAIAMSILATIVSIICFALAIVTGGQSIIAMSAIISSMISIFASILNLIALFLPPEQAMYLQKLAKIFGYISSVFSFAGSISSLSSLSSLQIANMVVTSVNFALSIASETINIIYDAKIKKEQERLNPYIEEYNKSVDEANEFLKENEFNELLALPNQVNSEAILAKRIMTDNYDELFEVFTQGSLDLLYADVENFYDRRLD